jgi:hypothetical protein
MESNNPEQEIIEKYMRALKIACLRLSIASDAVAGSIEAELLNLAKQEITEEVHSGFACACNGKIGWYNGDHPDCCGNCKG